MLFDKSENSSKPPRPDRMYRGGRPVDPDFSREEVLYYRISTLAAAGSSIQFRFPDFSVNRGKYSEPEDVLYPDFWDMGIVQFNVGDIPGELKADGETGKVVQFMILHEPDEDNYAHSGVHSRKEGQMDPKSVPETVKKRFRQIISERATMIRKPRIQL